MGECLREIPEMLARRGVDLLGVKLILTADSIAVFTAGQHEFIIH